MAEVTVYVKPPVDRYTSKNHGDILATGTKVDDSIVADLVADAILSGVVIAEGMPPKVVDPYAPDLVGALPLPPENTNTETEADPAQTPA